MLDGKHTFTALAELATEYSTTVEEENDKDEGWAENVTDKKVWSTLLVEAFSEGVLVDNIEFSDTEDEDLRVAYCAQAHDEDGNKFKPTSLRDMVGIAHRYKKRVAGGSWELARETPRDLRTE